MEMDRMEVLNFLKTKRSIYKSKLNVIRAERKVLNAVLKYVNNDETAKLSVFLNHRLNMVEQIELNFSLAIRYLTDGGIDSVSQSYIKNCRKFIEELEKTDNNEFYISLHDKYIENAGQFLGSKEDSKEVE